MNICIYCGTSLGNNKIYKDELAKLVKVLASNNCDLVYGGSNRGLMKVASDIFLSLNRKSFGVITDDLFDKEIANNNITKLYKVKNIRDRKAKMEAISDVFVALPGGYGTFEEMSEMICYAMLSYHKKPCVFYNINGYYDKLIEFFKHSSNEGFVSKEYVDMLIVSDNPNVIMKKIKNYNPPKGKWK